MFRRNIICRISSKYCFSGLFKSDSDYIQSVTDWSGVEFNKFIGSTVFKRNQIDAGGAFKAGSVFISPWYTGNFGSSSSSSYDSESVSVSSSTKTIKGSNSKYGSNTLDSTFGILIGFKNIGVKLGYSDEGTSYKKGSYINPSNSSMYSYKADSSTTVTDSDGNVVSYTGTVYDKDGEYGTKVYTPSVIAGTCFNISGFSFTPSAGLKLNLNKDLAKGSSDTSTVPVTGTTATNIDIDYEYTTTTITPSVALSVGLPKKEGSKFAQTVSFDWKGDFNSYDGDNYKQTTTTVTTESTSVTTNVAVDFGSAYSDRSNSVNTFNIGYKNKYAYDNNLTFAWKANANIGCSASSYSQRSLTQTTNTVTDAYNNKTVTYTEEKGNTKEYDYSSITVTPTVAIGMKYAVVPSKLDMTLGGVVTLPAFSHSETKYTYPDASSTYTKTIDADGIPTESTVTGDRSTEANTDVDTTSWGSVSGDVRLGLTWYLNSHINLDSALYLGITDSGYSIFNSYNSLYVGTTIRY